MIRGHSSHEGCSLVLIRARKGDYCCLFSWYGPNEVTRVFSRSHSDTTCYPEYSMTKVYLTSIVAIVTSGLDYFGM